MSAAQTSSAPQIAVYPGSFDPITTGHVDIAERASRIFSRVIVAIGTHPTKRGFLSIEDRVRLVRQSTGHLSNIEVMAFEGLVVEFCRRRGASVIVRGMRAVGDFDAEFRMGLANRDLAPEIETVFMLPQPQQQFVSSSLVREIAFHGGNFDSYVPACVSEELKKRAARGDDAISSRGDD